jgi:hypothetical protein
VKDLNREQIFKMIADLREERALLEEVIVALSRMQGGSIARSGRRERRGVDLRLCRRCGENKPASEFHRNGRYLMSLCRDCNTARCVEYYRRNRERLNQLRREKRRYPAAV